MIEFKQGGMSEPQVQSLKVLLKYLYSKMCLFNNKIQV